MINMNKYIYSDVYINIYLCAAARGRSKFISAPEPALEYPKQYFIKYMHSSDTP